MSCRGKRSVDRVHLPWLLTDYIGLRLECAHLTLLSTCIVGTHDHAQLAFRASITNVHTLMSRLPIWPWVNINHRDSHIAEDPTQSLFKSLAPLNSASHPCPIRTADLEPFYRKQNRSDALLKLHFLLSCLTVGNHTTLGVVSVMSPWRPFALCVVRQAGGV